MSRPTSFVCTLTLVVTLAFSSASAQTFTQLADYVVESGWVAEGISGDVSTGVLRRGESILRFDAISGVHQDTVNVPNLKDFVYVGNDLYVLVDDVIDNVSYSRIFRLEAHSEELIPTEMKWPHEVDIGWAYDKRSARFEKTTSTSLLYVRLYHSLRRGGRPSNDGGYFELAMYDVSRQTKIDSLIPGNYTAYFYANGEEVVASESGYADLEKDVVVYAAFENGLKTRHYRHSEKPFSVPVGTYSHIWNRNTLYEASSLKPILTDSNVHGVVQHLVGKGNIWVKIGGQDDTLYYYNLFTKQRIDIDTIPDSRNSSYRFLPFPDQQKLAVIYGGVRVTVHKWSNIPDNDVTVLTTPFHRRYQYDTVTFRAITTQRIDTASYEWYIGDTLYATTTIPYAVVRPRTLGVFPVRLRIVAITGETLAESRLDSSLTIEPRQGTTIIGHIDGWDPLGMEITAKGTRMILKTYEADYEYACDTGVTPWITIPERVVPYKYVSYRDQQSNVVTGKRVGTDNGFEFTVACHRYHPETLTSVDSTILQDIDMGRSNLPYPLPTERYTTLLIDHNLQDTFVVMHKRTYHELQWDWRTEMIHISNRNGFLTEAKKVSMFRAPHAVRPYDCHNGILAFSQDGRRISFLQLQKGEHRPPIMKDNAPFTAVHILNSNTIATNAGVYTYDTTWTKTDSLPFNDVIGFVRIPESSTFLILRRSADSACVLYTPDSVNHTRLVGSTIGSIRTYYADHDRKSMYVLDDHNVLHLWDLAQLPIYGVGRPRDRSDSHTDIGSIQRIECYDLMGRLLQRVNGSVENHSACNGLPHLVVHVGEHGMRRSQVFIGE